MTRRKDRYQHLRRFGKPAEDVEDVRLRSRLYSATSHSHFVDLSQASATRAMRPWERLSDIVEILAHGLLWLDVLRDYYGFIRSHTSAVSSPKAD